jgi:galactitol PTS system EIIC component
MEILNSVVKYIISFKAYVMLPIIIFIFSQIFRLKLSLSIKSSLTIGIGFIGIFVIFDFFVRNIGPAVETLIIKTGLPMNVLDVGWPPLASIAWSFSLAPLMILIIIGVNIVLLLTRLTKVVNIDIWNYWHFIMVSAYVNASTNNVFLAIAAGIAAEIFILKVAEWGAPSVKRLANLPGIAITTLSAGGFYPIGAAGNALLEKIPGLNKVNANPEAIKKRLGVIGEPIVIGFFIGALLGFGAGYEAKALLELAFSIAAVVLLLPLMCNVLGEGLLPISEGMKEFMKKRFPNIGETYMGLDNAVIMGNPAVVVTGLLLMPVAVALAFVLPGINFIPIGDLANTMALIVMIVVATNGNVIRSFIIGIPIVIAQLYVASYMAPTITSLAEKTGFDFAGYDGPVTSFLDGGLPQRLWLYKIFEGNWIALACIPAVLGLLFITWRISKKVNKGLDDNQDSNHIE